MRNSIATCVSQSVKTLIVVQAKINTETYKLSVLSDEIACAEMVKKTCDSMIIFSGVPTGLGMHMKTQEPG